MDNRSTIIISSLALIIGIGIGRFSAAPTVEHNTGADKANPQAEQPLAAATSHNTQANANELVAAAKTAFSNKDNHATSISSATVSSENAQPAKEQAATPRNNFQDDSGESAKKEYPNEISAEDIDRLIPSPFNESFKRNHGYLREKYKDFVANNQASDWDTRMQNKITDFIFSSPYAKFLSVEFLACKAGLCEIRLFETKQGTFSMILSEMALQDWWDIGGYHASGNGNGDGDGDGRTAYHVLLPRK